MMSKIIKSKMMKIINCKIYVVLKDSTMFTGILKYFDHHFNLILDDCEIFLKDDILLPPALHELNRQTCLLGSIAIRGQNLMSIDTKPGFDVPKVPITDIIICRLEDYRCENPSIKSSVSTYNIQDSNWNIEDPQADIMNKDLYYIPMVDPTALIIKGQQRPPSPPTALINEDYSPDNCLATNGPPLMFGLHHMGKGRS